VILEWTDDGIVLGTRRHGEAAAILELLTRHHGRHLGLVRGGAGSRLRPVLQPGNTVRAVWRARLDEHLGYFVVEGLELRAADLLAARHAVYGVTHLSALCRLLPERDPHPAVHDSLLTILDGMQELQPTGARIAQFELQLLAELGFGLDLERCAATGERADLVYVSPKSGRAVSRAAGAPWQDRLLVLPAFLSGAEGCDEPTVEEIANGFALTGFFLNRYVLEPRGGTLPESRTGFLGVLLRGRRTRPGRASSPPGAAQE
jgi:DNA repair protein RecO (recombination protein O)